MTTNATAILRKEHEAILHMLDVTDEVVRRIDAGDRIPPETLTDLLEFFRQFADRCHHGKEEDLLFPLLEAKGMPREEGPIGVMLVEHDQGRSLVRQMAGAAQNYTDDLGGAGELWADAARSYSTLLRQHIHKENDVLFMVADNLLSDEDQAKLAAEFEKAEIEKMGPGTHERLHELMDRLMAEVLPS